MTTKTINAPAVQRLRFGKIVSPHPECDGYVIPYGKKALPKPDPEPIAKKTMRDSDEEERDLDGRIHDAVAEVRSRTLSEDEGPYADKGGCLAELADAVSEGAKTTAELVERVIDLRAMAPPEIEAAYPRVHLAPIFAVNESYAKAEDLLPTAGEVLSQKSRLVTDDTLGTTFTVLTHPIESLTIAVAVLRAKGMEAYPSLGVMPDGKGDEMYTPLISIVEPSKSPSLRTFAFIRSHPPLASLDIISDEAMMGVLNIILAQTRTSRLFLDVLLGAQQNRVVPPERLEATARRIGTSIFKCHKAWPGCYLVPEAFNFFLNTAAQTFMEVHGKAAEQIFYQQLEQMQADEKKGFFGKLFGGKKKEFVPKEALLEAAAVEAQAYATYLHGLVREQFLKNIETAEKSKEEPKPTSH